MTVEWRQPEPSGGARTAAAIRSALERIIAERDREQTTALLRDVRHYLDQLKADGEDTLHYGQDMGDTYTQDYSWVYIPLTHADVRVFRASVEETRRLTEFLVRERVIEELVTREDRHLVIMGDLIGEGPEGVKQLLVALGLMRAFPAKVTLIPYPLYSYLDKLPTIRRYFQLTEPEEDEEEDDVSGGFFTVFKGLPSVAFTREGPIPRSQTG